MMFYCWRKTFVGMVAATAILLCLPITQVRADQVLDVFDFSTTSAARSAWIPSSGTPAVALPPANIGSVGGLDFPCRFTADAPRCYWDRAITADLSNEFAFSLHVYVENPEHIASLTLYFRSGTGWYSASRGMVAGWQTLRWSRSDFAVEGAPAGWDQIDGIRFSPWKALQGDALIVADQLRAYTPPVTIVQGTRNADLAGAQTYTRTITAMLDSLGIDYSTLTDEEAGVGPIRGKLVILPYNSNLSSEEISGLENFVAAGGKLMVFYTIPSELASLLGVQTTGWTKISLGGMRFESGIVDCAPDHVSQASWNITLARAMTTQTRVLAWWEDDLGRLLPHPAWFVNPNGAYMTHVLLDDDPDGKRHLLLALISYYIPELKSEAASSALESIGRVGPYTLFDDATAGIREAAAQTPRLQRVQDWLTSATSLRSKAVASFLSGDTCSVLDQASAAHQSLVQAFLYAQHPKFPEFRAVWNHSGTGVWPGDWDRSAQNLADNGFTAVFANLLWAGLARYDSAILPHDPIVDQYGDQAAACVEACHAHGIQVHVWKVDWNLGNAPASFIQSMRDQGRTQVDVDGNPVDWLCPSDPRNYQLELDTLVEVATKYNVDGIHFDYIRYPNDRCCYCDQCRQRFQQDTGITVQNWPLDCYSGPLHDAYRDWRVQQITRLVRGVSETLRPMRPNIKISAAVFPQYPDCRTTVGQDWVDWVQKGYLDFVCPMDYTDSPATFQGYLDAQLGQVGGKIPVYPGVGVSATGIRLNSDQTIVQLQLARDRNTGGYIMFNYDAPMADTLLPDLHKGFTAEPVEGDTILFR